MNTKRIQKSHFTKIVLLICFIVVPWLAYGINSINSGFRVGDDFVKIEAHSRCNFYKSIDGREYFIPTKTLLELDTLSANKPSWLDIASCAISCTCRETTSESGQGQTSTTSTRTCRYVTTGEVTSVSYGNGCEPSSGSNDIPAHEWIPASDGHSSTDF